MIDQDAIRCQRDAAIHSAKARKHVENLMQEPSCAWAEVTTTAAEESQKMSEAYYRFARRYMARWGF